MTRIDFYVLPTLEPQQRRVMACKLTEKAWRRGMKVFIRTGSEMEDILMDDLLWTFRQGSFIPHARGSIAIPEREDTMVLIGHQFPPLESADLLINLGLETPSGLERFERLAELVDQDTTVRLAGRQRYRSYKSQGFLIETHHVDPAGAAILPTQS
jgi:DNA polymerase-3 subunit chi